MTSAERKHLAQVASLSCVVCRNLGHGESPAEIHHLRSGQGHKRASHYETLPLCHIHHRTGGYGVAFHAGAKAWQENFGTELELLEQTNRELGL